MGCRGWVWIVKEAVELRGSIANACPPDFYRVGAIHPNSRMTQLKFVGIDSERDMNS